MKTAESDTVASKAAGPWYQCRPRALLLILAVGAVIGLSFVVARQRSDRYTPAVPGRIRYRERSAPRPIMEVARFDCPVLADGYAIDLHGPAVEDGTLANANLEIFSPVRTLNLERSRVTDAGLVSLGGLDDLISLDLDRTKVTDAGLQHLKDFTQLQWLSLQHTQVSDVGIEHLKGLSQLKMLDLSGTQVSEQGLEEFRRIRPKCEIRFGATASTLQQVPSLQEVQAPYRVEPTP